MPKAESWIIEESEVDPVNGVVRCTTKNLDHVKVMRVEEHVTLHRTDDNKTLQKTQARFISNFGWGLTKRIESHSLARFKANVQRLSSAPPLPLPHGQVIAIAPSPRKTLFCALSKNGLSVWKYRPCAILAHLSRTSTSLLQHGENVAVEWSPDTTKIVIQTTQSYLVFVTVQPSISEKPYQTPSLPSDTQRSFLPGPGEALPLHSVVLHFEGVIRIDGHLLSASPRRDYILFSARSPPSVQRISWPQTQREAEDQDSEEKATFHDTWEFNEQYFPWMLDTNGESPLITALPLTPSGPASDGDQNHPVENGRPRDMDDV
ncbi:hypothetical protein EIP86_003523 [Pleurotus ostreatoroseus]|nr:hypothetical protein EIP86_003523 [Pleurotus ostreatoroseus]